MTDTILVTGAIGFLENFMIKPEDEEVGGTNVKRIGKHMMAADYKRRDMTVS